MAPEKPGQGYRCDRCGKTFTSRMRLQHHRAAQCTPPTLKDIRTTRHIPHSKPGDP